MLFRIKREIYKNTTFTCAATGTDAKYTGSNAIAQVLQDLERYNITRTVTIQLADGVYGLDTPSSTISVSHRDISQIVFQGNYDTPKTFDLADSDYAPVPAESALFIKDSTGAAVPADFAPGGDYQPFVIYIVGETGNAGAHKIISATAVDSHIRLETSDSSILDESQIGTVYLLPANRCQLIFDSSAQGFSHYWTGSARVNGLYMYGDGGGIGFNGVGVTSMFNVNRCIMTGWTRASLATRGAEFFHYDSTYNGAVVAIDCDYGFSAVTGGKINMNRGVATLCDYGFYADGDGYNLANACVSSQNTHGFMANELGKLTAHSCYAVRNHIGCRAYGSGRVFRSGIINIDNEYDYSPDGDLPITSADGSIIN